MLSLTDAEKIGEQAGSNPGGFYLIDGVEYYVKQPQSFAHGANEALANALYREAGIPAPEVVHTNGYLFSRIVKGEQDMAYRVDSGDEQWLNSLREGFILDAWLANWDVFGMWYDNIITDENGQPWRIDNGGAIQYRAMGTVKVPFEHLVPELHVMRSGSKASIYGDIPHEVMVNSMDRLRSLTPGAIGTLCTKYEVPTQVGVTLIARRSHILNSIYLRSYHDTRA